MGKVGATQPLADVCSIAYASLATDARPEYIYKNILVSKTVFGTYSPNTTSWLYEFSVGSARADAVLINGVATAFEIKTDLDDLSRASDQVHAYYKAFQRIVFAVGASHVEHAVATLPPTVGIWCLSPRNTLSVVREPSPFCAALDSAVMFDLLRQRERERFMAAHGIDTAHARPVDRYPLARQAAATVPPTVVYSAFVDALRRRSPASKRAIVCRALPPELRAAVFGYRISESDWTRVSDVLNLPVATVLQ